MLIHSNPFINNGLATDRRPIGQDASVESFDAASITLHKVKPRRTFALERAHINALQSHCQLTPEGVTMKTILMLTAVLLLAGCGDRKGTASGAGDTTAAMTDTSMMHDTTMIRDTAAAPK
jgi:hypothetical protein